LANCVTFREEDVDWQCKGYVDINSTLTFPCMSLCQTSKSINFCRFAWLNTVHRLGKIQILDWIRDFGRTKNASLKTDLLGACPYIFIFVTVKSTYYMFQKWWFIDYATIIVHSHPCSKGGIVFTTQCTLVQSAVLRSHVIRLSVTLVDCDHIGWKSWKLIARTISPTPSLFVAKRQSTYSQGNMGKFWGYWGGVGKSGVRENKSGNISEMRGDGL